MRPENPECVDYKKTSEKIDPLQSERFLERWHRCKIPDCQAFQQLSQRYQLCSQLHTNRRGVANNFSSWVYIIVASTSPPLFRCCNALWSNFWQPRLDNSQGLESTFSGGTLICGVLDPSARGKKHSHHQQFKHSYYQYVCERTSIKTDDGFLECI